MSKNHSCERVNQPRFFILLSKHFYQSLDKHRENGNGSHPTKKEHEDGEDALRHLSIVGNLLADKFPVKIPSNKKSQQNTAKGQYDGRRHHIEEVKDGETEDGPMTEHTKTEATQHAHGHGTDGNDSGGLFAGDMPVLVNIGSNSLVQGEMALVKAARNRRM